MIGRTLSLLRRLPRWLEAVLVLGIAFGDSILLGLVSSAAPTIYDDRMVALVVIELLKLAVILPFLHLRGWRLRSLVPRMSAKGAAVGLALCLAAFILHGVLRVALQHLAGVSPIAAAEKPRFEVSHLIVLLVVLVNPIFEELLSAGYLINTLEKYGGVVAVSAGTLLRISYHLYLGWISALAMMLAIGFLFGAYYWRRRDLWPLIVAHAASDLSAVLLKRFQSS
jgi:membrane protease YdiL (CAAX protease family)